MTNNALVLHYFDRPTAPVAASGRDVPAEWVLGSAFLAAVVVALLAVAGVFANHGEAGGEWAAWASLWFVAFVVLAGSVRVAHRLSRHALSAASAWRARRAAVHAERALRSAAHGDPRVLRELQILRDRAEWHASAGE